jgi:glucose-6-phosphate-specific signal transduction histidine kinase
MPPHPRSIVTRTWRDTLGVIALVLCFASLALHFELSERLLPWLKQHESWQVDELPLTLLVLSLGLVWFAFRRVADTQRELREREAAQEQVSALLAHNRDLTQRLFNAQEDERRILAQELHDEVAQACTALRIEGSYIAKAAFTQPDAVVLAAQRISTTSQRMHSLTRDMLKRLRPPQLDSMGLESALQELCRTWQTQCGIRCELNTHDVPDVLDDYTCTSLYRVTQEALTNIAKHAQATQVHIRLQRSANTLHLCVEDNGIGLSNTPDQLQNMAQGFGWVGMRERVASLQGSIDWVDAQPGLRIDVHIPMKMTQP